MIEISPEDLTLHNDVTGALIAGGHWHGGSNHEICVTIARLCKIASERDDAEREFDAGKTLPKQQIADSVFAQLHTEIEQRQFIGDLIDSMPHAQIAAELEEFKLEVAAALGELRDKVQVALTAETPDSLALRQEIMIDGIDAMTEKLGLALGKEGLK